MIGAAVGISNTGHIIARTVTGFSGPNYACLLTPK